MGRLNKEQQWFLLSRLLKLNPHTPWHGAALLVEQPVSMHKVDLADYELKLRPCCDIIPFSLSVSAPLRAVPRLVGPGEGGAGVDKRKGG